MSRPEPSGPAWNAGQQRPLEPLTPVEIETRLRQSITMLTRAEGGLREARDAETEAEIRYRQALYRAHLSRECPTVGRGATDATVAERDAWVQRTVDSEWQAYKRAETFRESAQDHLRTVRDVVEVLRSLGASVRTAYDVAGSSGSGQR